MEGDLAIAAAILVLFTAMLDPIVSAALAVGLLGGAGAWKVIRARRP